MNREFSLILYIACFVFSTLLLHKGKKTNRKLLVILSLLIPICIAGLRYYVGTDFEAYLILYNKYEAIPLNDVFSSDIEISFVIICKIASIFNNPRLIFWIYAIITLLFSYHGINKLFKNNNDNIAWMLFVYLFNFYINSFNIMRQGASIAISLYAISYIFERKLIKYVFYIFLAFLFHKSSIIMLPLYFIYDNKKKIGKQIFICLFATLITINFDYLFQFLIQFQIFEKYSIYDSSLEAGNKTLILNIIICCILIIKYKKLYKYNEENIFFITMYIVGTIISFLGFRTPFLKRLSNYYLLSSIPLFANLITIEKKAKDRLLMIVIVISLVIGPFIISLYILNQAELLPYRIN